MPHFRRIANLLFSSKKKMSYPLEKKNIMLVLRRKYNSSCIRQQVFDVKTNLTEKRICLRLTKFVAQDLFRHVLIGEQ